MKRFSFRLQSVLDLYSSREELELIKLNDLLCRGTEVESAIRKHVEAMQSVGSGTEAQERAFSAGVDCL